MLIGGEDIGQKCFEAEVGGSVWLGDGVVSAGGLEDFGEAFEGGGGIRLVVGFACPSVGWSFDAWPVDEERGIGCDGHIFQGPTVGGDDGGSSRDEATGGEDECGEDAIGAGHGDKR